MKAARIHATGGPSAIVVESLPDPEPGPGEVLVRLTGAGVNYADVYQRTGLYPAALPATLGSEGAGTVVAIGADVPPSLHGQRVVSVNFAGSYATLALAPADRVIPVPGGVADDIAAGALLQGMTAHYLLRDSYPVQAGDTVLVHAAAGGMGLLLTQLATRFGARVIGTASTPDKADLARAAGAAEVVGYADVVDAVRSLTGGEGVAAAYDGVGAATFAASMASLRRHGVLVSFGNASGKVPGIEPLRLANSIYLTRPTLGHFIATPADLRRRAADVLEWVSSGALDIRIGGRYPLAEAATAHTDLESRRTTGKLLITP
jgi:NADPH:quinone reductase